MTKRKHETKEERKERKRLKREEKKRLKKERKESLKRERDANKASAEESSGPDVFFRKKLELTISLLPGALGNVVESVEDSLRTFLLKYSDGIEGILLAFENVTILGEGMILNDLPHIHYNVQVDALVFSPVVVNSYPSSQWLDEFDNN